MHDRQHLKKITRSVIWNALPFRITFIPCLRIWLFLRVTVFTCLGRLFSAHVTLVLQNLGCYWPRLLVFKWNPISSFFQLGSFQPDRAIHSPVHAKRGQHNSTEWQKPVAAYHCLTRTSTVPSNYLAPSTSYCSEWENRLCNTTKRLNHYVSSKAGGCWCGPQPSPMAFDAASKKSNVEDVLLYLRRNMETNGKIPKSHLAFIPSGLLCNPSEFLHNTAHQSNTFHDFSLCCAKCAISNLVVNNSFTWMLAVLDEVWAIDTGCVISNASNSNRCLHVLNKTCLEEPWFVRDVEQNHCNTEGSWGNDRQLG